MYEDDKFLAYLDINPFSKGHTLVIPKEHYPCLAETPDGVLAEQIATVKKVAAKVCGALNADGFNVLQNNGEAAGQTVKHIHFHIVPRYVGGKVSFEGAKADMDELAAIAKTIDEYEAQQ